MAKVKPFKPTKKKNPKIKTPLRGKGSAGGFYIVESGPKLGSKKKRK